MIRLARFAICALVACGVSNSVLAADVSSVTVDFHGKIVDTTCSIGIQGSQQKIELGTYPVGYFTSQSSTTEEKTFNLEISKCQLTQDETYEDGKFPASRVHLTFTDTGNVGSAPGGVDRTNGLMNLTQDGADNVGIQVQYQDSGSSWQNVFDTTSSKELIASNMKVNTSSEGATVSNLIPMKAFMAPSDASQMPTSGEVNGQMTVTLTYE